MHGFVAVVAPEQWAAPGVEPIGPHLFGLVAREPNPDMQHYSLAANGAAEATGRALLGEHSHEASHDR